MPLTRATVTSASSIMLPTYVLFTGGLGLTYLLAPASRLVGAALSAPKDFMPMHMWGVVFLGTALAQAVMMLRQNREWTIAALCYGCALYVVWTGFFIWSIAHESSTSPAAWQWPAFVATAHVASIVSLMRGEHR